MEGEAKPLVGQDLSGLVSSLLSNPAALSMLSSLVGSIGARQGGEAKKDEPSEEQEAVATLLPTPKTPRDERARLLEALRPFLSHERCEMIDTLLKILDLMAVLRRRRS